MGISNLRLTVCMIITLGLFGAAVLLSRFGLSDEKKAVVSDTGSWQSRYIEYDDGWYVDERIYRENGLENEENAEIIFGPFVHMSSGSYYALVDYETFFHQSLRIYGFENEDKIKTYEDAVLPADGRQVCYRFDITEDIDNFEIRVVYSGKGSLKIKNICVYDKQWGLLYHLRNLLVALGLLFLVCTIVLLHPGIYGASGNRELWIDMVRGIGIILVYLGHSTGNPLIWLIYGFHMPLFFILSGYLYKKDKIPLFCLKLCRRYILPYLVLCAANSLLRIPYMFVGGYSVHGIMLGLIGYLKGSLKGDWRQMPNCMPLWFLPALAVSLLLFRLINTIPFKAVRFILYFACAVIGYKWNSMAAVQGIPEELPWGQHTVFTDVAFIAIGCGIKELHIRYKNICTEWTRPRIYLITVLLLLSGVSCITIDHLFFSDVDIYFNNYGNIILTYAGAVFTSISLILICIRISRGKSPYYIPVVIGCNSMFFFAFDFWGKTLALYYPRILDNELWIVTFVLKSVFVGLLFVLWKNLGRCIPEHLLIKPFVR